MTVEDICRVDNTLRDYQQAAKDKIFEQWLEVDNVLYQMPTGTGKTRLFTSMIRDISVAGIMRGEPYHILIIAHRTELIVQISNSLHNYHIPHGLISGAFKNKRDLNKAVQVASVQTISHSANIQYARMFRPDFIVIDEAHHSIAATYTKLWEMFPDAKKLGVTATPWRMDGRGFTSHFDVMIPSMTIKQFLNCGWLAPYAYYSVGCGSSIYHDISNISEFGIDGDYKISAMQAIVDTGRIRAQLLDSYLRFAKGKKGIIYSISRIHSENICLQYRQAGVRIAAIDGSMSNAIRHRLVEDFKNDRLDVIVNVDIFSEGFDCPAIEFVQLARPTKSLVKYIQQIGRGLRKNGDKFCVILDNVGAYNTFGLPDDDRDWDAYFHGVATVKDSNCIPRSTDPLRGINIGGYSTDLSEGYDDMVLIQTTIFENKAEPIVEADMVETLDGINDDEQIMSSLLFVKYRVVIQGDSIYLRNERTAECQLLAEAPDRLSFGIKVLKSKNIAKEYMIACSLDKHNTLSASDIIVGVLSKVGRLMKFKATRGGGEAITIRV